MIVEVRPTIPSARFCCGRWWSEQPTTADVSEQEFAELRADGYLNVNAVDAEAAAVTLAALHAAAEVEAVAAEEAAKALRAKADELAAKVKASRAAPPARKPAPTPYQDAQRNARPSR